MDEARPDVSQKLILVGESGVGKTNLLSQFLRREFHDDSTPTIGVEFGTLTQTIGGKLIQTQIWDTAGQERYRAITAAYFRSASGAILVYDVTQRKTFETATKWIADLRANVEDIAIILVGNKMDLAEGRVVSAEEGRDLSEKERVLFIETSAKDCTNIQTMFGIIIEEAVRRGDAKRAAEAALEPEEAVATPGVTVGIRTVVEEPQEVQTTGCCGCCVSKRRHSGSVFEEMAPAKELF
jgi:small GTP-binding protein